MSHHDGHDGGFTPSEPKKQTPENNTSGPENSGPGPRQPEPGTPTPGWGSWAEDRPIAPGPTAHIPGPDGQTPHEAQSAQGHEPEHGQQEQSHYGVPGVPTASPGTSSTESGAEPSTAETSRPEPQGGQTRAETFGAGPLHPGRPGPQEPQPQPEQDWEQPWELQPTPARSETAYAEHQPAPEKQRRGLGIGGVTAAVLIAGLIGGGAALGGQQLLGTQDTDQGGSAGHQGIEINNTDEVTAISAAADKAAPSVVTLAVAGQEGAGSGSGIILDEEGHILTNTHVVTLGGAEAEPEIQVRLSDGRVSPAEVVGTDPLSDLAVIRLDEAEDLVPAELGTSTDLNVGDQTIAIGAPLSLEGTVTTGIVSTLDRTIQVASAAADPQEVEHDGDTFEGLEEGTEQEEEQLPEDGEGFEFHFPGQDPTAPGQMIYLNVIQTDAAINQGNSGGALVDSEGNVIGVNVAIATAGGGGPMGSEGAGSIGVGFAIPIDYAQRIAEDLIEDGEASHGLLGVHVTHATADQELNDAIVNEEEVDGLSFSQMPGFSVGGLVVGVAPDSPAAEAGIEEGDVIEEVEGRRIEDSSNLTSIVREYAAGETITLTVRRDGESVDVDVTLGTM